MSREINMSNAMPKIETFLEWLDKILWGDRSTLWSGSNELAIWSDKSILLILPHLDFTHTWLIYKTTTYFAEFLVADKVSHFFIDDDDNSGNYLIDDDDNSGNDNYSDESGTLVHIGVDDVDGVYIGTDYNVEARYHINEIVDTYTFASKKLKELQDNDNIIFTPDYIIADQIIRGNGTFRSFVEVSQPIMLELYLPIILKEINSFLDTEINDLKIATVQCTNIEIIHGSLLKIEYDIRIS